MASAGALRPGRTLLDATSGNTGIAYAMLGAAVGYPVKLCVPSNVTKERKRLLEVYGAQIVWTSAMDGSDGAIREARQLYAADPDTLLLPGPVQQPANWRAHYEGTGSRSWSRPAGRSPTSWRDWARAGRSWERAAGCARRTRRPAGLGAARLAAARARGAQAHGQRHRPAIYDASLADEDVRVDTEAAWNMVRRLAREEGIFAGVSGAAALVAAISIARRSSAASSSRSCRTAGSAICRTACWWG